MSPVSSQPLGGLIPTPFQPSTSSARGAVSSAKPLLSQPLVGLPYLLSDVFSKAADADILPEQNAAHTIPAQVMENGQIQLVGQTPVPVPYGQMDVQGNYLLGNGQCGNIFKDAYLNVHFHAKANPFALALCQAEQERAYESSEIPAIRENLTAKGIDGRGIKIVVCEPYPRDAKQGAVMRQHSQTIEAIIRDKHWGVAPGAQTEIYRVNSQNVAMVLDEDNPNTVKQFLSDNISGYFRSTAVMLNKLAERKDPSLRLVNISWGPARSLLYTNLWSEINREGPLGEYLFPDVRDSVLGQTQAGTIAERQASVMRFVDEVLERDPQIQRAYKRYVDTTRQASRQGITVVVAVGNNHNQVPYPFETRPGSGVNMLMESPYVLGVAACDTNCTPGLQKNYDIPIFSSIGDGRSWNPIVAAPGAYLPLGASYPQVAPNQIVSGTSYSAPYLCGVIAMMLQLCDGLSFNEIQNRIRKTAVKTGHSKAQSGSGMLNVEKAVLS